jgi:hypothetical protein
VDGVLEGLGWRMALGLGGWRGCEAEKLVVSRCLGAGRVWDGFWVVAGSKAGCAAVD